MSLSIPSIVTADFVKGATLGHAEGALRVDEYVTGEERYSSELEAEVRYTHGIRRMDYAAGYRFGYRLGARGKELSFMRTPDFELAQAFELDAIMLRKRGLFDNARLCEECALSCRAATWHLFKMSTLRGLEHENA